PAGIRTPDTLLKRQVLCRLSYWVISNWQGRLDSLFCGKATAAQTIHRIVFKSRLSNPVKKDWQGRLDSNQRMSASKADALPLGDAPVSVGPKSRPIRITRCFGQRVSGSYGVGKGTRTLDPRNHNPML